MTEPKQWAIEQHIKKNPKCEWLCTHTKLENLGEQPEDRPITEPTIDELISNLACATHFLPEEDCIYCDTEKIKALISDQVAKAKLEAFDVAFDCHDYDRLRAYRAKLLKEVK